MSTSRCTRTPAALALLVLAVCSGPRPIAAAEGDLDGAFASDGVAPVNLRVGDALTGLSSCVWQPDGKLVVAGNVLIGGRFDWFVARYRSDGTLDPTFSGDGRHVIDFDGYTDGVAGVAIDSMGRIVIAGAVDIGSAGQTDYGVARLLPDGSPDESFGSDGLVWFDLEDRYDSVTDLAIDGSDRILVIGGSRPTSGDTDSTILRLTEDGALDSSFGDGGISVVRMGGPTELAYGVAIDSQGRILVGGEVNDSKPLGFVFRLSSGGDLDGTFGNGGKRTFQVSAGKVSLHGGLALGPADSAYWTGLSWVSSGPNRNQIALGAVKVTAEGELDASFGDGGVTRTYIGDKDALQSSILSQPDGKVVIYGSADAFDTGVMVRLNGDGSLDGSFGDGGKLELSGGGHVSAAVLRDGRFGVIGLPDAEVEEGYGWVAALTASGAFDDSFSGDGTELVAMPVPSDDSCVALLPTTGGRLLAVGTAFIDRRGSGVAVARFHADGRLDTSYGAGGVAIFPDLDARAIDAALLPGGGVVVAVQQVDGGSGRVSSGLVALTASGSVDAGFADNGRTAMVSNDAYFAVIVADDGKILAGGYRRDVNNKDLLLVRYGADGTIDSGFSSGGVFTHDTAPGKSIHDERIDGIALQGDGKIVVTGSGGPSGAYEDFVVGRLNANGSADTGFGTGGFVIEELSASRDSEGHAVAVLSDGRILAVGHATGSSAYAGDMVALMLTASGARDAGFGTDGVARADCDAGARDEAYGVAQIGDGFLLVGTAFNPTRAAAPTTAVAARLDASGNLVGSFAGDGKAVYDVEYFDHAVGVALDGAYAYVGGYGDRQLSLARLVVGDTGGAQAPVITEGESVTVNMDEDGSPTAFALTLHATDADSSQLTWSIGIQGEHGLAGVGSGAGSSQAISYQPDADYHGADSFTVVVSDGLLTDSITVSVQIAPQDDDPSGSPEIEIRHGGSVLADGGRIDGPTVVVGGGSATVSITIQNIGSANLLLPAAELGAVSGCTPTLGSLPTALAPNASATLQVSLTAETAGAYSCQVEIHSSDADEGTTMITITGDASDAPATPRTITIRASDSGGVIPLMVTTDVSEASVAPDVDGVVIDIPDARQSVRLILQSGSEG